MKYKTTHKFIKNNSIVVFGIGYCDAQTILRDINPESYCHGLYGWRCDNYDIGNGYMISTGYDYANTSKIDNVTLNKIVDKYEEKARAIRSQSGSWDVISKKLAKNLKLFVNALLKAEEKARK